MAPAIRPCFLARGGSHPPRRRQAGVSAANPSRPARIHPGRRTGGDRVVRHRAEGNPGAVPRTAATRRRSPMTKEFKRIQFDPALCRKGGNGDGAEMRTQLDSTGRGYSPKPAPVMLSNQFMYHSPNVTWVACESVSG